MFLKFFMLLLTAMIMVSFTACIDSDDGTGGDEQVYVPTPGTYEDPFPLTVSQATTATIYDQGGIYYSFTTPYTDDAETSYTITTSNSTAGSDIWLGVSTETNGGGTYMGGGQGEAEVTLLRDTKYYMNIGNQGYPTNPITVTTTLLVAPGVLSPNDGVLGSPVSFNIDSLRSGKVETVSYYSFTTSDGGSYTFSTSSVSPSTALDIEIFNDSSFTSTTGIKIENSIITTGVSLVMSSLSTSTTYYIKITNPQNSATTFQFLVTAPTPIVTNSEGTAIAPVEITALSSFYTGATVGYSTDAEDDVSYYKFTTNSTDTTYKFTLSGVTPNANLDVSIYSSSGFSGLLGTSSDTSIYQDVYTTPALSTSAVYYFKVTNTTATANATYSIYIEPTAVVVSNEGSVASPVWVTVDTSYSGKVGIGYATYDKSYYTFTTTASTNYTLAITNVTNSKLSMSIYTDSNFSSLQAFSPLSDQTTTGTTFSLGLLTSTVYYLQVTNEGLSQDETFDLLITGN